MPLDNANIEQYITSFPLDFIKKYLDKKKWKDVNINQAFELYKNYIYIRYKYRDLDFPPSEEIDIIWKIHILHTQNYREFCKVVFSGEYLDRPSDIDKPDNNLIDLQFQKITQRLYFKEYGEYIPTLLKIKWWRKLARAFKQLKTRWITTTVLATIAGTIYTIVSTHNSNINTSYNELKFSIRSLSYDEEESRLLCSSKLKERYPTFFIQALYKAHLSRRTNYANFLNSVLNLEQSNKLGKEAHEELLIFSRKTNILYEAGLDVCKLKLEKMNDIRDSRKQLTNFIWRSRKAFLWLSPP